MKKNIALALLLVAALISLYVAQTINKTRTENRKQAAEGSSENVRVNDWSPINVSELSAEINQRKNEIARKTTDIRENQSYPNRAAALGTLNRASQIENILGNTYPLMDENNDGVIDYQEFNKYDVGLYSQIYPLRHPTVPGKQQGMYDQNWQKLSENYRMETPPVGQQKLFVIVEANLYNDILPGLAQYKADVESEGTYGIYVYLCNFCNREEIKNLLRNNGVNGALFVGDIPSAWVKTVGCFGWEGYTEIFPTDLYYMDYDGSWSGETDCDPSEPNINSVKCFTSTSGNIQPEIFVGRITSPNEADEISLINNYFRKLNLYRSQGSKIPQRSLNYVDDDWAASGPGWSEEIAKVYPDYLLINDNAQTNATDYKSRLNTGYEHLLIMSHSSPTLHALVLNGNYTDVYFSDIRDLKPKSYFYNLFACSNARFTTNDYMGGWYTMQEGDNGLLSLGSTKTGSMVWASTYYQLLSQGINFGESYKDFLRNNLNETYQLCWHLGMTMIGDPTLKPSRFMPTYRRPTGCDATCGTCGWRDESGTCHTTAMTDGSWCCHFGCADNQCVEIIGKGPDEPLCVENNGTRKPWGASCNPSISPSPSPSPAPQLNLKVKFQGVTGKGANEDAYVKIINRTQSYEYSLYVTLLSDSNGIYSGSTGTMSGLPSGTCDIYIKGWSHLNKKFSGINIAPGTNSVDFSSTPLMAGDISNNNILSIEDLSAILATYTSLSVPVTDFTYKKYDLDANGIININDIAIVLSNYTQLETKGDEVTF